MNWHLPQLTQCSPGRSEPSDSSLSPASAETDLVPLTHMLPPLLQESNKPVAEASSWMGVLGMCLGLRAAAGLPPLRINTGLVSAAEALVLLSELRAAGHAGYAIHSTHSAA